jgi:uncharacterized protein (TIGR02246 family)
MSVEASEAQAIDRTREAHVGALNRGDADGWGAAFADDAVQMPPNAPPNVGKDEIQAFCGAFLSAFGAEFSLAPEEVQIAGADWAFERGTYTITLTPKGGGEPIPDAGKYITVYQRQPDGSWAMARDIWNSSNPLPGVPE